MYVDYSGEIVIQIFLVGLMGIALLCTLTSSEHQTPTEEQIKSAQEFAETSKFYVIEKEDTVVITFNAKDLLDNVDPIAMEYFYQRLYDKSLMEAQKNNLYGNNIMDVDHIRWETEWHICGYILGFSSATTIDLNYQETRGSLIYRGIKAIYDNINNYSGNLYFLPN